MPVDRALLVIGADIIELLDQPLTVSRLWNSIVKKRQETSQTLITFDWFVLALDMLYSLHCIEFKQGLLSKTSISYDPSNI